MAQDFVPEGGFEVPCSAVQNTEEAVESFFLQVRLPVHDQVSTSRQNREPQALKHAQSNLLHLTLLFSSDHDQSIFWRVLIHSHDILLMEHPSLFLNKRVNQIVSVQQVLRARLQHLNRLQALVSKLRVPRVLVQAVDQLDESLLDQFKMPRDGFLECVETLHHEVFFGVLRG